MPWLHCCSLCLKRDAGLEDHTGPSGMATSERVALQAALPVAPPHTPGAASCTICSLLRAAPAEACTGCQPHACPPLCCSHRCEHMDHPDAGRCFQRQLQRRDTTPTAQKLGTLQLDVPLLVKRCDVGRVQLVVYHSCLCQLLLLVLIVHCLHCALQSAHRQLCASGRGLPSICFSFALRHDALKINML